MASFVIESRVLAGIQFEDIATGVPIRAPLHVRGVADSAPVVVQPNRRNIHVIVGAPGLEDYVASFLAAPSTPPLGDVTVELEVRDPSGIYLPRRFSVDLPRTTNKALPDSVFEPIAVPLLRSPRASRSRNWAMVRVRLLAGASEDPVTAALLRVVQDPAGEREILGWGMSVIADPQARELERRSPTAHGRWIHFSARHVGEASVPVVGLSGQVWGVEEDEDVILSNIDATLEVVPMTMPVGGLPNPDDFFATAVAPGNSLEITLSVGGDVHAGPISVNL
ncbi:MAG TPA: hypothetical protein VM869_14115 [Enhygromyxa sp.]|nr:hypothetical protein [Enhygromyxa sp.]